MLKKLLHISLIPILLFSIADFNRIALLVASISINNGCDTLFCTCAGSCSCTLPANHTKEDEKNTTKSLPVLINLPATTSTCCPISNNNNKDENFVQICSCDHNANSIFQVILLRTLDKVIIVETDILFSKFLSYTLKTSSSQLYALSYVEEIFHPPRV